MNGFLIILSVFWYESKFPVPIDISKECDGLRENELWEPGKYLF